MKLFLFMIELCYALQTPLKAVEKVAIIGAGASGSLCSYYLNKFLGDLVEITVYEKESYVGGRTITMNKISDIDLDVELGLSVFIEKNLILMSAVEEFNLTLQKFDIEERNSSIASSDGIWDLAKGWVYQSNSLTSRVKFLYKYGVQIWRLRRLVNNIIENQFLPNFYKPFKSLHEVCVESGMIELTNTTASEYLLQRGFSLDFIEDFIAVLTRNNYSQEPGNIHALGALITLLLAFGEIRQVKGGNWQIFDRFIQESGANLKLETAVQSVEKVLGGYLVWTDEVLEFYNQVVIATPQNLLTTRDETSEQDSVNFITVDIDYLKLKSEILGKAALNNIVSYESLNLGNEELKSTRNVEAMDETKSESYESIKTETNSPDTDYVQLHVYIIASQHRFNFHNSSTTLVNTLHYDNFTTWNLVDYRDDRYIYKVFSLSNGFDLHHFIDGELLHHQFWHPYPILSPTNLTASSFELQPSLWHLNIEHFTSTMETELLLGLQVACLIAKESCTKFPILDAKKTTFHL